MGGNRHSFQQGRAAKGCGNPNPFGKNTPQKQTHSPKINLSKAQRPWKSQGREHRNNLNGWLESYQKKGPNFSLQNYTYWEIHLKCSVLEQEWTTAAFFWASSTQRGQIVVGFLSPRKIDSCRQKEDFTLPPPRNKLLLQVAAQWALLCAWSSEIRNYV